MADKLSLFMGFATPAGRSYAAETAGGVAQFLEHD
jgi:hypothetical protein